ncbi:MAG: hypothetical protein ABI465_11795 [Ktedonobacteraceae bacterium]
MNDEERRDQHEAADYELFLMGFRLGYPMPGDSSPTVPDKNSPAFQRGLEAGKAAASQEEEEA